MAFKRSFSSTSFRTTHYSSGRRRSSYSTSYGNKRFRHTTTGYG